MFDLKTNKVLFEELFGKSRLVSSESLSPSKERYSYLLAYDDDQELLVKPNQYALPVSEILRQDQNLWAAANIRVVPFKKSISARALYFGVPFGSALEKAISDGLQKSLYFLPDQMDGNIYSFLLFHVNVRTDGGNGVQELQVWQYCVGYDEVFYLHAESYDFGHGFTHLDGAVMYLDDDAKLELFNHGSKVKSSSYEKHFRIDGNFSIDQMHKIASSYLPVTELFDEAFCVDGSE